MSKLTFSVRKFCHYKYDSIVTIEQLIYFTYYSVDPNITSHNNTLLI